MRKSFLSAMVAALIVGVAVPVNAATTGTLDQRVQRLERMLENPVLLQLSRRLGEQQREIQNLQDENDRLKRDLANLTQKINSRYAETDERLSVLEGSAKPVSSLGDSVEASSTDARLANSDEADANAATSASEVLTSSPKGMSEPVSPVVDNKAEAVSSAVVETESAPKVLETRPATDTEKEAYKAAFALMRSAKYSESIAAFEDFQKSYPESNLASNAAYWAGEGYLVKDQSDKALDSFMVVLESYPDSSKVPDATLRAGDSYDNLGQRDKAVEMYKKIIADRPLSKAAKNAKKRLAAE